LYAGPNIVLETVKVMGTVRTEDEKVRQRFHRDIPLAAEKIAESAGAQAKAPISKMYDTTINDEALAARILVEFDGEKRLAPPFAKGTRLDGQRPKATRPAH
jgi:metal-dependent amidase/aminoacylase/carboxypeptidase family protein